MNNSNAIQAANRIVASENRIIFRRVGAARALGEASVFSTVLRFDAIRFTAPSFAAPPPEVDVVSRRIRSVLLMRSLRV
jgi:hypothetical protein